ncbi:MAG: phage capsid protein [Oscillospiraceae bacterium]|nr:phage capsid protein [Oscillospiraceae bacterium]
MPVTLNEMKVGMHDKIAQHIVDKFIRESEILELLPFDNCVSPSSGSTMVYGYVQKKKPSAAQFRALNTEYTPSEATVEDKTAKLKIFGGAFEMDRVINDAAGDYNNLEFQVDEKIKSAVGLFHDAMINGDEASNALGFDGLDKFLVGSESEFNIDGYIDLSTMDKLKENADVFYEALLKLINRTGAQALMVNETMKTKIQTVARILGYKTESEEAFGRTITSIGEGKVRLIDLGNVYAAEGEDEEPVVTETPIINLKERNVGGSAVTGLTDIYGVRFSVLDGFHGVTLTGEKGIKQFMPDFKTPGAVKKGEVEMVACVALKNSRAAGVLRNIKVL